jgi:calpain-15
LNSIEIKFRLIILNLGLSTVTGSPCETLILGRANNPDDKNVDHDKLWMKLLYARSQRFLMCAMCSNNLITKQEFENCGLLNVHAYSLQDVKQSNDGQHRLIKLRNPWGGTYRWTGEISTIIIFSNFISLISLGDWSDDSPLWTQNPDLRRELLKEKRSKRDGVFWMPFSSFAKYFECVDICKIRPDWYEVRDSANFYPEGGMMQAYSITIRTVTELDITLHRKISKNLRIQRSEVSLCVAIVNIEEQTNGNYRIYSIPILSQRGQHKFVSTDGYLQPGTYIILPFLFNPINKHMDNTEFNIG